MDNIHLISFCINQHCQLLCIKLYKLNYTNLHQSILIYINLHTHTHAIICIMIATSVVQYKLASAHTHIYILYYNIIRPYLFHIPFSYSFSPPIHPDGPRKSTRYDLISWSKMHLLRRLMSLSYLQLGPNLMGKPWEIDG